MVRMGLSCVQGLGMASVCSLCLVSGGAGGTKGGAASPPAPP